MECDAIAALERDAIAALRRDAIADPGARVQIQLRECMCEINK